MKRIQGKTIQVKRVTCFFAVLYLMLIHSLLHAERVAMHDVAAAVETWVRHVTVDARPDGVIERLDPYRSDGETVAYIAHLAGGGFCLCGADDLVLPVYFYCPEGMYDPDNPELRYILREIGARTMHMKEELKRNGSHVLKHDPELQGRAEFWMELIGGEIPERVLRNRELQTDPVQVELELTSRWHQGWPYNKFCPVLTPPDEHVVVGCVATSTSQIMHYWGWPQTGVGTGSTTYLWRSQNGWCCEGYLYSDPNIPAEWANRLMYNGFDKLCIDGFWDESIYIAAQSIDSEANYLGTLQKVYNLCPLRDSTVCNANFGFATYQWDLMADEPGDLTLAGEDAVATLCHHVGVAVGMYYGVFGSFSSDESIPTALENHFRYDSDALFRPVRDIYEMTTEITWGRPLVICGCEPGGGCHAWVIYGYNRGTDPARQFLMHLGWGGPPGWYTCPENFPADQSTVVQIAPPHVKFVGADNPGDGSPDNPYVNIEEANNEAPDNATLFFKAGSDNTFSSAELTMDRPLTLKGYDVTIRRSY